MSKNNLREKIGELRDLIHSSVSYKQKVWNRKDKGDWSKLWTAVDNIEDTQLAINEYSLENEYSRLSIYGLLQAMVVQQDAITHMERAIEIQVPDWKKEYPDLKKIRDIRHETVGHPVSDKREAYTSISHTNIKGILEYGIWTANGFERKTTDLADIIKNQHDLLVREIDRILNKIMEDDVKHKEQFKYQSLSDLLKTTSYYVQKLWPFERDRTYSKIMFESLCNTFEKFKEEVRTRYGFNDFSEAAGIPGVVYTVEKVEKLLPRIKKMLPMGNGVDALDLEVYVESLSKAFDELRTMAKEIDEEFTKQL